MFYIFVIVNKSYEDTKTNNGGIVYPKPDISYPCLPQSKKY